MPGPLCVKSAGSGGDAWLWADLAVRAPVLPEGGRGLRARRGCFSLAARGQSVRKEAKLGLSLSADRTRLTSDPEPLYVGPFQPRSGWAARFTAASQSWPAHRRLQVAMFNANFLLVSSVFFGGVFCITSPVVPRVC